MKQLQKVDKFPLIYFVICLCLMIPTKMERV